MNGGRVSSGDFAPPWQLGDGERWLGSCSTHRGTCSNRTTCCSPCPLRMLRLPYILVSPSSSTHTTTSPFDPRRSTAQPLLLLLIINIPPSRPISYRQFTSQTMRTSLSVRSPAPIQAGRCTLEDLVEDWATLPQSKQATIDAATTKTLTPLRSHYCWARNHKLKRCFTRMGKS